MFSDETVKYRLSVSCFLKSYFGQPTGQRKTYDPGTEIDISGPRISNMEALHSGDISYIHNVQVYTKDGLVDYIHILVKDPCQQWGFTDIYLMDKAASDFISYHDKMVIAV